jgi:Pyruvate/2-oxoacid:ferredoxin oxidoreductase gamma subunit
MITHTQNFASASRFKHLFPAFSKHQAAANQSGLDIGESLNLMVVGIGGLGVVNLSRRLRDLIASHYPHVHTVEQRGVAQRRSSTAAVVMASKNEIAPNLNVLETDLLIGLEPLEALRFSHKLRPGSWCFISDLRVETIGGSGENYAYPDTRDIVAKIEGHGCHCILLPLSRWKSAEVMEPVHASSAMLGLFCAVFGFDSEQVKHWMSDKRAAQKNVRALEWGFSQFDHDTQIRWSPPEPVAEEYSRELVFVEA